MGHHGYIVNEAAIVAELFDNEAIIMDLSDGVYYTLSGTSAEIWSLIESGFDASEMATNLSTKHSVDLKTCEADVKALLAELLEKSIILETTDAPVSTPAAEDNDFGPYATPKVTCHTDMAEVMAMDPPLPELTAAGKTSD
jgi:hypothetical protein